MRGKKEPLEKQAVAAECRTAFAANTGGSQTIGRTLNQIFPTGNITACRSKSSTGILNQGTGEDIGADMAWFADIGKLTIAVVYHDGNIRVGFFYDPDGFLDFLQ